MATPSSSACARPSSRQARRGRRVRGRPSPRRSAPARRVHRRGGHEARARARAGASRVRADLAAHCINDVITTGAEPLLLLDYVRRRRSTSSRWPSSSRARPSLPRRRRRARRRRDRGAARCVPEGELDFAGTCVGVVDRDDLVDGSRVQTATRSSGCLPLVSTRTASRSSVACSRTRLRRPRPARARGCTSTTSARLRVARKPSHVTGGGSSATSRASCRRPAREIDWEHGSGRRSSVARPPRRGGRAAARLQPRDRLLRDRHRSRHRAARHRRGGVRDRRARLWRGHEPAGPARRGPARRRRDVERPACGRSSGEAAGVPAAVFDSTPTSRARRATPRWRAGSRSTASSSSCCAGYMHLLTGAFLERFRGRVVNVHPRCCRRSPARDRSRRARRRRAETG